MTTTRTPVMPYRPAGPASRPRLRLTIVSPYPPRVCPTAVHTDEMVRALRAAAPEVVVSVCAVEGDAVKDSPPEVVATIARDDPTDYRRAAHRLRARGTDVALIQYRPQAAGGKRGRDLLGLVDELTRLNVPVLVAVHEVRRSPRPDDADITAALCRRAAGVIAFSDVAATLLTRQRFADRDRIAVVPPGAPPELWDPVDTTDPELPVATGTPRLSTITPLLPAAGVHIAVTAMAGLAARHPDVRYVVGDATRPIVNHDYRRHLESQVTHLGLDDRVEFVDRALSRDDVAAALRSTSVYLHPSLDPGQTTAPAVAYALAAGVPVVASNNLHMRGLVTPDVGVLVPPGDPAAIAAAVTQVLDDPVRRATMRAAAAALRPRLSFAAAATHIAGLAHLVARQRAVRSGPIGRPRPKAARRAA